MSDLRVVMLRAPSRRFRLALPPFLPLHVIDPRLLALVFIHQREPSVARLLEFCEGILGRLTSR